MFRIDFSIIFWVVFCSLIMGFYFSSNKGSDA